MANTRDYPKRKFYEAGGAVAYPDIPSGGMSCQKSGVAGGADSGLPWCSDPSFQEKLQQFKKDTADQTSAPAEQDQLMAGGY